MDESNAVDDEAKDPVLLNSANHNILLAKRIIRTRSVEVVKLERIEIWCGRQQKFQRDVRASTLGTLGPSFKQKF
jgi:hypothetical protein